MNAQPPTQRNQAVELLLATIPEQTLMNVLMMMQNKQTPWHYASHFGLGLHVRNKLRSAGFNWSDVWLDDNWHTLVEEAARRHTRG